MRKGLEGGPNVVPRALQPAVSEIEVSATLQKVHLQGGASSMRWAQPNGLPVCLGGGRGPNFVPRAHQLAISDIGIGPPHKRYFYEVVRLL